MHIVVKHDFNAIEDYEYEFWLDGSRQRCKHKWTNKKPMKSPLSGKSYPLGISDNADDGKAYTALHNYGLDKLVDLNENRDIPAGGVIDQSKGGIGLVVDVLSELNLHVPESQATTNSVTVSDFVKDSEKIELSTNSSLSDDEVMVTITKANGIFEATFSKTHHYLLTSFVAKKTNNKVIWSRETTKFAKVSNDLSFPESLKSTVFGEDGDIISSTEVQILSLNAKLPETDLVVKFPKGLVVFNQGTGETMIWGDDGPEKTFRDRNEYTLWRQSMERQMISKIGGPPTISGNSYVRIACLIALGIAILFGLIAIFRRRS